MFFPLFYPRSHPSVNYIYISCVCFPEFSNEVLFESSSLSLFHATKIREDRKRLDECIIECKKKLDVGMDYMTI